MRHALFTPSAARPMATSLGLGRAEARLAEALAKEKARTLPPTGFGWALLATPIHQYFNIFCKNDLVNSDCG
jgi:hypothetical protein